MSNANCLIFLTNAPAVAASHSRDGRTGFTASHSCGRQVPDNEKNRSEERFPYVPVMRYSRFSYPRGVCVLQYTVG